MISAVNRSLFSTPVAPHDARLKQHLSEPEWLLLEPLVAEIAELKARRGALVLAHNYQTPDIFYGVADVRGDSLALARAAAQSDAAVIVMCGVRFMAETVKILCPDKIVLLPDPEAGCSLAASIEPHHVRQLRQQYPGVPVVCYVNTSAHVKAECDVCCTSANAVDIVRALGSEQIILVPDKYLARYVAARTGAHVISWTGHCEVHRRFTGTDVFEYRRWARAYVLAHPECPEEIQDIADYVGSTSGMIEQLATVRPPRALLLTECSMSDNVSMAFPDIEFVRPCNLCPHMKRITLEKIRDALAKLEPAIDVPAGVAERAGRTVNRMLELTSAR